MKEFREKLNKVTASSILIDINGKRHKFRGRSVVYLNRNSEDRGVLRDGLEVERFLNGSWVYKPK